MIKIKPIIEAQDAERLLARLNRLTKVVDRGYETPCHEHAGAVNNSGYAKMNFRHNGTHVQVYAHRVALVLATGRELPSNFVADHKCQNPRCRNAAHLQLATPARNSGLFVQQRKATRKSIAA
jgi:hypothetical protein